jgi:hypothetical protein
METIKKINTYIFFFHVVLAVAVIGIVVYSLLIPGDAPDTGQSRLGFLWSMWHTFFLIILLFLSFLLHTFWEKLFPANTPLAIVLLGFYFSFPFITFTGGWVSLVGFGGVIFALISGVLLAITNYVYFFKKDTGQLNIWLTISEMILASIVLTLFINSLLTDNFSSTSAFSAFFLGLFMLVFGIGELQKKRKGLFVLSIVVAFLLFFAFVQL